MHHSEIFLARLFNDYLPGLGNFTLRLLGLPEEARPWANFMVMELLVVLIIVGLVAILGGLLTGDQPGQRQDTFGLIEAFVHSQPEESVGHDGPRYLGFFGTL